MRKTLLIGFGNPGRLDDGLGPACAEAVDALDVPGVTVEANYQLNVEDASQMAEYDVVVLVDAAVSGKEPFDFKVVEAARELSFSTHSVEPGALVTLARDFYQAAPRVYTLAIRGYEFNEFGERLSEQARTNLKAAIEFITKVIQHDLFDSATTGTNAPERNAGAEPCKTAST